MRVQIAYAINAACDSLPFTADQYAVYKWLGRKFTAVPYAVYKWWATPSQLREGVLFLGRLKMTEHGFYIVSDVFFDDFPDPFLKGNKAERRPHYYCFTDKQTGLYWLIPMSSRVEKYKKLIDKRELSGKPCDIFHIAKLDNGKEGVFLIQDMFPITSNYILRKRFTQRNNYWKKW